MEGKRIVASRRLGAMALDYIQVRLCHAVMMTLAWIGEPIDRFLPTARASPKRK